LNLISNFSSAAYISLYFLPAKMTNPCKIAKTAVLGAMLCCFSWGLMRPSLAQPRENLPSNDPACKTILEQTATKINQQVQAQGSQRVYVNYQPHTYADGPANRPYGVNLVLGNHRDPQHQPVRNRMERILTSPVYMQNLSQAIIQNCKTVGLVSFIAAGTDWVMPYGMVNEKVVAFKGLPCCEGKPAWGYYFAI
jgi:hypothetical protein